MTVSESKALVTKELTHSDIELIKATVAKGATDGELKLFLYRAKELGLNPLKPGQLYFVKYKENPGTIIVGLDGFRALASRTGKHAGTKRGVTRDENGVVVSAWCEVYREDWKHPAREEVSMAEYNVKRAQWNTMPETMLKKVAECAALRMAFPDDLGGVYGEEERDVIESPQHRAPKVEAQIEDFTERPDFEKVLSLDEIQRLDSEKTEMVDEFGSYVFKTGNARKGKRVQDISTEKLKEALKWYEDETQKGKAFPEDATTDFYNISAYLDSLRGPADE